MIDFQIKQQTELSTEESLVVRMFALAHTVDKYWILSNTKSVFIPGFKLLFVCGCEKSDGPESIANPALPQEGDIGMDYKGEAYWKIKTLNWA